MKKIIISSVLFGFAVATFCQQTVQKHILSKTDYLQKSKKQKKTGWILVASGAALLTAGIVIPKGELTGEISYPCFCEDVHENDNIKAALGLVGVVSGLASIPFFIASSKNKRRAKAASVFIDTETKPALHGLTIRNRSFPAIGMRISL